MSHVARATTLIVLLGVAAGGAALVYRGARPAKHGQGFHTYAYLRVAVGLGDDDFALAVGIGTDLLGLGGTLGTQFVGDPLALAAKWRGKNASRQRPRR